MSQKNVGWRGSLVSILTESTNSKRTSISEVMEFLLSDKADLENDLFFGLNELITELNDIEILKLHNLVAADKKIVSKMVSRFKNHEIEHKEGKVPRINFFPYMEQVIQGALEKDPDQAIKLVTKCNNQYINTIKEADHGLLVWLLESEIEKVFSASPTLRAHLNNIDKLKTDVTPAKDLEDTEVITEDIYNELLSIIDESAVTVKDKVTKTAVNIDKKIQAFSDKIDKIKAKYKERAKNSKGEEIVKDSWQIARRMRQLIAVTPFYLVHPAVGLMVHATMIAVNTKVNKEARGKYIGDLKLEIKIIDDIIQEAESKGDNKTKRQMIREKDKLERALEKIMTNSDRKDHRY